MVYSYPLYSPIIALFSNVAVISCNLFASCPFANVSKVTVLPFDNSSVWISIMANFISSFSWASIVFSPASFAFVNFVM